MLKRILAALLCVIMLASVLPVSAYAAAEDQPTANEQEAARIRNEITRMYYRVLYASGMDSLHGFCGMMSSYQLWLLGVNPYPIVYNGNDHYNGYENKTMTLGGHTVKTYSAREYTLEEALNTVSNNGTKNVYNILVGFQWTNTQAGQLYGHSLVINAIIDGVVYFSEGYASEFNLNPGMPCVATIEEFARSYNAWTSFEGIVVFGRKDFTDFCKEYPTHLFVEVTDPVYSLSLPSSHLGETVRQVAVGERLEATAIYENTDGELFYQIVDDGKIAYFPGSATELVCFNFEDVTATDATKPEQLALKQDFNVNGHIRSRENWISGVQLQVSDAEGQLMFNQHFGKTGKEMQLGQWYVNNSVNFQDLEQGIYTYGIYADVDSYYIEEDAVVLAKNSVCLSENTFAVDTQLPQEQDTSASVEAFTLKNGWEYADGKWRYYEDGQARTGWFCYNDIDYFLLEDGSAATGWYTINGKNRYFTSTGAMRTGWLETDEGTYYMLFNGIAAKGERTINGLKYTFDENGLLITE